MGKIPLQYRNGALNHKFTVTDGFGIRPQFLHSISETEAEDLLSDPTFFMQPLFGGCRLLLLKRSNQVTGINRLGLEFDVPESVRTAALAVERNFLADGELVDDSLHDLPPIDQTK